MDIGKGISKLTKRNFIEIYWGPQGAILGTSLYFAPSTENRLLWASTEDGSIQTITARPDTFSLPSMQADNPIALVTVDVTEIWLVNVEAGTASYLADGEGAVYFSDGNRILIYISPLSKPELRGAELRVVDLDGNLLQLLPLHFQQEKPLEGHLYLRGLSLANDGHRLYISLADYEGEPNTYVVYAIDLSTGNVERFPPSGGIVFTAAAHGDSRLAAIRANQSNEIGEVVITKETGECVYNPNLPFTADIVTWSPDNSKIAILSQGSIYILDLSSSPMKGDSESGC